MSHRSDKRILITPEELLIDSPDLGKLYVESLRLNNTLAAAVDLTFKLPSHPDRVYEITPQSIRIPPGEDVKVELRLKVLRGLSKAKSIRDVINIKADYFEQQFMITYKAGERNTPTPTRTLGPRRGAEDLDRENKELKIALEEKSSELIHSQAKISELEEEIATMQHEMHTFKDLQEELVRLKEANEDLSERLEDNAELHSYFDQVKTMLNERMPNFDELIDLSLKQERQKHQRMSEKALAVLKAKDAEIEELNGRIEEQQEAIQQLHQKLTDSRVLISNTEQSLKHTQKTVEELKMTIYDKDQVIRQLETEMEDLRNLANRSETDAFEKEEMEVKATAQLEELRTALHHMETSLSSKTSALEQLKTALEKSELEAKTLREKEQYVLELSARQTKVQHEHERLMRDKDRIISELTAKVSTQTDHIQSLISQFSQQRDSEVISKVLKLEEENRHLQMQLAESRGSSRSMKEEDLRGPSRKVHDLEEENARLSKSIKESNLEFSRIRKEMEESLAGKNRELIDMQQRLLEMRNQLTSIQPPHETLALSEENHRLKQSLHAYEQKHAELLSENELLAKRLDRDSPGGDQVTQTQLISRLNARVTSLKAREDRALEALAKAEEALRLKEELLNSERSQWMQERDSLRSSVKSPVRGENAVVQTEKAAWEPVGMTEAGSMEQVWTNVMLQRYERRLAELDKDATAYQMKHYAALKETHDLKEQLSRRTSEDIESQTKWERDIVQLQVKCDSLRDQLASSTAKLTTQSDELSLERSKTVNLKSELEKVKQEAVRAAAAHEGELIQLAAQRDSLQGELKERTAQVAILMESLVTVQDTENSENVQQKCAELAVQLSKEQAVISNLELRIADLKALLLSRDREILENGREKSAAVSKSLELETKNQTLTQVNEQLTRQVVELRQEIAAKTHDNSALSSQIQRLQDDLADAKAKVSTIATQLTESEKRNSQVLAKERREFKEALLTAKNAPLQVFDVSQPVVLALKQLTVALNALSDRAPSEDLYLQLVKDMGELVLNCDKSLIMAEAKIRRLEFLTQSEIYFRHLDPVTIEMLYSMLNRQEMMANELKKLKKPQQTNMQEVYRRRIEELEAVVRERNEALKTTEAERTENQRFVSVLREQIQGLEGKIAAMHVDKAAFETLALSRAEEELKAKSRLRDEGVKTYIDGVITRAALSSSEASKLLSLSREIAALKLANDQLVTDIAGKNKERDLLFLSNEALKVAIEEWEKRKPQEITVKDTFSAELRTKIDLQSSKLFDLTKENTSLKGQISDLEQQVTALKSTQQPSEEVSVPVSAKEEDLKNQLLELKEQHRTEVESLRIDCNLKMQQFKKELESEYSKALEQFQDGEYPGDYKRKAEMMERQMKDMAGEQGAMEDMLLQAQAANASLNALCTQLKEENELIRAMLADLQMPMPRTDSPPSPKRSSSISKKSSKKQLSLDRPPETRTTIPVPQKLVKALVSAKIGEAEASRKLRSAGKLHIELRENALKKDAKIRELEAKLKTMESRKRGNESSLSIPEKENEPVMTLKSRIIGLEQEVNELRLAEASHWAAYEPLLAATHDQDLSMSDLPRDDFAILVEGIVYLTQHLDQEASSNPAYLEQCQRLVIRALGKTIGRLSKEPLSDLIEYRPTRAEDRQVWYLELAETQLNEVNSTVRNLKEFINKLSVEITGSFTGSAQYKGASLELAKCIKETADELETMKNVCLLVKNDLNGLRPNVGFQEEDELAYRDRATLAENMKRRLEEEMVNLKMQHSFALSELESQVNEANEVKKRTLAQLDVSENERIRLNGMLEEVKTKVVQTEIALDKEREVAAQLKAQIGDLAAMKQDAGRQVDKFQKELRQWQTEHKENLREKEDLIAELQRQVKGLEAERDRQERTKKQKTQKRGDVDEEESLDLRRKLSILTEEKKLDEAKVAKERESFEVQLLQKDAQIKELRVALQSKDTEIDSLHNELKKAMKVSKPPRQKEKQADLELEVHSQAIEIMNIKNEYEGEVSKLQALIADLQRQLREKVEFADLEVRKRLEVEGRMRDLSEDRRNMEGKLREISENTAVEVQSWQEEAGKIEGEMSRLRKERDALSRALQAKTTEADTLAQVILQTERDHKSLESDLRADKDKLSEALSFERAQQTALSSELKQVSSSLQSLQAELRSAQSREEQFQDLLEERDAKITELRTEILNFGDKQRTWEQTFEALQTAKEASEATFNDQIKDLKAEMSRQFEAYSKNLEMSEAQLNALKDVIAEEQKTRKGVKKGMETVDFYVQMAKKDAVINALKSELRTSKKKTSGVKTSTEEEPQIYRLKTKIHTLKSQLAQEKDQNSRLQEILDRQEQTKQETKDKDVQNRREMADIERKYKAETQRLAEEVNRIREKWHSPEEWGNLVAGQKDLETVHKRTLEELRRKSELLDNMKSAKEQQDSEANALQDELENIKDIAEQVKRLKSEMIRKDRTLQEMKTALEQMREGDKRLGEENAVLVERLKVAQTDVKRKDTMIRDLKAKLESMGADMETGKAASDQVEKLREQVKRLKQDVDRKDAAAKLLRTKLETAEQEVSSLTSRIHQASTDAFTSLESELNKNKVLDANLKRSEAQLQALYLITRRIFRELVKSVETLKLRVTETEGFDREMYSDCMNILRLSEDELKEFVGQGSRDSTSGVLEQIDRLLEEKSVNVNEVIELFERLLEERAQLERSTGEVAGKYQDYIRRMQQEVMQEREAYEQKIKDLEASIRRKRKA